MAIAEYANDKCESHELCDLPSSTYLSCSQDILREVVFGEQKGGGLVVVLPTRRPFLSSCVVLPIATAAL